MSNMSVLEQYQRIKSKHDHLPMLTAKKCAMQHEVITEMTQLDQKIAAFAFDQGWLCYQSTVIRLQQTQAISVQTTQNGLLLYGELVNQQQQQSLHIRQHLAGTWKLTWLQEVAGNEAHDVSETLQFIAMPDDEQSNQYDKDERLAIDAPQQYLQYQRYSKWVAEQGYQPYAARFIGFSAQE